MVRPYAIGDAYCQSCRPKPTSICKSLYFVVTADITMPNPVDNIMSSMTTSGTNNNHQVACMSVVPVNKNANQTTKKRIKLMINGMRFEMAVAIG